MSEAMLSMAESGDRSSTGVAGHANVGGLVHGECQCPVESEYHHWRFVHTELIPLKVQDAYKLVFVHDKFMLDVLAGRKTYKYVAGDWARDPETGASKRTLTYTMAFTYGKNSYVTETQVLSEYNRAGEAYVVLNEVCNEGVPLADNFSIMVHICLLRAAPPTDEAAAALRPGSDWCRYSCYAQIKYKKTVWGMIKGQLERSAYGGMEGVHKDVATALKDHALGAASTDSGHKAVTVQQVKRKRRTKTLSTDISLRFRKELPGKGGATNWGGLLINMSLLFLIVVLSLANVVLYSRVKALETFAHQAPSETTFKEEARSEEPGSMDYNCPDDTAKRINSLFADPEGGVWVRVSRVLARQEELYFTELEEIRHHLNEASRAVLQVDSEVNEVLKKLPRTMTLLANAASAELKKEMSSIRQEKEDENRSLDDVDDSVER